MIYIASYKPNGEIYRTYAAVLEYLLVPAILTDPYPAEYSDGMLRPDRDYWNGSSWAERPAPPPPPSLQAGAVALWSGLPPGAIVTVDPLNGAPTISHEVDSSGTMEISLPAGPWGVAVNEVFPYTAASWRIEVAPE